MHFFEDLNVRISGGGGEETLLLIDSITFSHV